MMLFELNLSGNVHSANKCSRGGPSFYVRWGFEPPEPPPDPLVIISFQKLTHPNFWFPLVFLSGTDP